MKIVVNDIKKSINNLSNYIDVYEENYLNRSNLFSEIRDYWIGENSILFFNKIDSEQKQIYRNISEIKELLNVYKYIAGEYSFFGNEIIADVEKFDYLLTYFNVYLNMINQIIVLYDNIPVTYFYLVEDQRRYFINLKQQIMDIKNNIRAACNRISRIETNIENKVSKVKIEIIKETEVNNLI